MVAPGRSGPRAPHARGEATGGRAARANRSGSVTAGVYRRIGLRSVRRARRVERSEDLDRERGGGHGGSEAPVRTVLEEVQVQHA
jgi:hypothetical protein